MVGFMRLILSLAALFLSVILLQLSSGGVGPLDALTGLRAGLQQRPDRDLGLFAFSGLFHRLLVGAAGHGERRAFAGLCGFHLYGRDWHAGSYPTN